MSPYFVALSEQDYKKGKPLCLHGCAPGEVDMVRDNNLAVAGVFGAVILTVVAPEIVGGIAARYYGARAGATLTTLAATQIELQEIANGDVPVGFPRIHMGRVTPPVDLTPGTTPYGVEMHRLIAGQVDEMQPGAWQFRVGAGERGPDGSFVGGGNFSNPFGTPHFEIKSFKGESAYNAQVGRWGLEGDVTPLTYDYDGNWFMNF